MTDINLQTLTPDTTLPTTGFLFGADSQASGSPSVFTVQSVATTLLGSTTLTGATITADAPVLNLAQTWNNAAITFTGLKLNATDTASAAASLLMDLQVGGSSQFTITKTGLARAKIGTAGNPGYGFVSGATGYGFYSAFGALDVAINGSRGAVFGVDQFTLFSNNQTICMGASADVILARDAANILAQRNGVNAQAFRLYNTYTDASNYERFDLLWNGNEFFIRTIQTGTGTPRSMYVGTAGSAKLTFFINNIDRWTINTSGHFLAATDNTYDIGASGATRPRNLFMASYIRNAVTTVGALPAAATAGAGAQMFVSDALAPTFGAAVAAGGAVTVPVHSTGTAWNVG